MAEQTKSRHPWRSLAELEGDPRIGELAAAEFSDLAAEAPELPAEGHSRRRFLSLIGATAALAAASAGCSRDIDRGTIVPYTKRPAESLPGRALYYATSAQEGLRAHSLLIKTREARPILIEGNDEHPAFRGSVSLRLQAELLGLYDPERLTGARKGGQDAGWDAARRELAAAVKNGRTLLLTEALLSPARAALVEELKTALPGLDHFAWEPAAEHGALAASADLAGAQLKPVLHLDRARVILTLDADPLGGEGAELRAIRDFAARRRLASSADAKRAPMNRLWAAESRLTLTGGKADHRLPVDPSQAAALAFALAAELAAKGRELPAGVSREELRKHSLSSVATTAGLDPALLQALLHDLDGAGAEAVVIAGSPLPAEAHAAARLLNRMLGAEGATIDYAPAALSPLASPADLVRVTREMAAGQWATVIVWGVNPAHGLPAGADWAKAIAGARRSFRLGLLPDETAASCEWALGVDHWLESWGDFEGGLLQQPAVAPLHDTKQAEQVLLDLAVDLSASIPATWQEFLERRWNAEWRKSASPLTFQAFWNAALHDGLVPVQAAPAPAAFDGAALLAHLRRAQRPARDGGHELLLHPDRRIFDGRGANIGWLQELPEPVTKLTWGNPLLIGPADAKALGLASGDRVKITTGGRSLELPVAVQPGQKAGTLALALGYGRKGLAVADGIGVDAMGLCPGVDGLLLGGVQIQKLAASQKVHTTQEHHLMEGRDLVRRVTLGAYAAGATGAPGHGGHAEGGHGEDGHGMPSGRDHGLEPAEETPLSLYPVIEYKGRKWGMSIDLSACVGCAGCVIACQAENNIPVVGPERVDEGREMHWIRIDRYYEGDEANPDMVTQPMLCQHCDNAPCENVCPVAATTHNEEGLNQMTYNRCVGTRYCANNCPYKVRRFNFFDYTARLSETLQLAMNPEVTIRPRGVMEKCTFCVQRINDARSRANGEKRPIRDGEFTTACAAACPAEAIVFGDLNDHASRVAALAKSDRGYGVLADLGVGPAITYLSEVKNPAPMGGAHES